MTEPSTRATVPIVLAEDDEDDQALARAALTEARLANPLFIVQDGRELLEFLRREGKYAGTPRVRPGLILLDLKMPRMDGIEALTHLKRDPDLKQIPVVVLTTSNADEDISRSYELGVNSFIRKPITFAGLVEAMKSMARYWFEIVELPPDPPRT